MPDPEKHWKRRMEELFQSLPPDCGLNTEETAWSGWPRVILLSAEVNSGDANVLIRRDAKDNLRAFATVTVAGARLPLLLLARRKTEQITRSQIGHVTQNWVSHSPSGRRREDTFKQHLELLRQKYSDRSELHLLSDSSRAQNKTVTRLNIMLYFIPPGVTHADQFVDRSAFRVLKGCHKRGSSAWDDLTPTSIEAAWDFYPPYSRQVNVTDYWQSFVVDSSDCFSRC
jgi:hypothetical protein